MVPLNNFTIRQNIKHSARAEVGLSTLGGEGKMMDPKCCTVHLPKQKGRELPPQTLRIMQELEKDLSPIPALLTSLVQCSLQPSPTVLLLQLSPMLSPFFLPSHVGQNGVYFGCNEKCFLLAAGKEAWLDGREVDTERKANRLNWGKWAS